MLLASHVAGLNVFKLNSFGGVHMSNHDIHRRQSKEVRYYIRDFCRAIQRDNGQNDQEVERLEVEDLEHFSHRGVKK